MIKRALLAFPLFFFLGNGLNSAFPQVAEKTAVLWCDPLMNIRRLGSRQTIVNVVRKARSAGFSAIALGVKTNTGEVIYESKVAPRLLDWQDYRVPLDFDAVQFFLQEAHRNGLQLYAVFPVFAGGEMLERKGIVYSKHSDWQTVVYAVDADEPKIMPITEWAMGPVAFLNPLLPEVQKHEIALITEFLEKYSGIDGLILDKVRFSGIEADFSDFSRKEFESYLGSGKLNWWPEDVYELQLVDDEWQVVPGEYYQSWIQFRAARMRQFYERIVQDIKKTDPSIPVGSFVGAWYPTYYEYGVNWASESNVPEEKWATSDYYKTAVAEKLSYLVVGCFFPRVTMEDAEKVGADWWMSVEGSAITANEVVNKVCPVYGAILVEEFKDSAEKFSAAVTTANKLTDGLYVYDLSEVEKYKYWDELGAVLRAAKTRAAKRNVRR